MRKITVTEALTELKLLDARINKAIVNVNFCGAAKKSSDRIGAVSKETFKDRCKADFQSATDLIKNHSELKSKIIQCYYKDYSKWCGNDSCRRH